MPVLRTNIPDLSKDYILKLFKIDITMFNTAGRKPEGFYKSLSKWGNSPPQ